MITSIHHNHHHFRTTTRKGEENSTNTHTRTQKKEAERETEERKKKHIFFSIGRTHERKEEDLKEDGFPYTSPHAHGTHNKEKETTQTAWIIYSLPAPFGHISCLRAWPWFIVFCCFFILHLLALLLVVSRFWRCETIKEGNHYFFSF